MTQVHKIDAAPDAAPRETRYIPTLDGWRAVAIVVVMLQHASDQIEGALGDWVAPVTGVFHENGRFGVYIFFAISGFLITSLLAEELGRVGRISLRSFYIRRAFRILPPLLAVLTVLGILGLTGVVPIPLGKWISSLLFFNNYMPGGSWYLGHLWSLAIEEQFYIFWPLLLAVLGVARARRACVVLIGAIAVWRLVDLTFGLTADVPLRFDDRTDTQADGLIWGCLLALICLDPILRRRLAGLTAGWRYWAYLVLLVVTQAVNLEQPVLESLQLAVRPVLIALLVVGTVLSPSTALGRTLELRPLRWVGRISYSLYLWQQLFLVWDGFGVAALAPLQTFPLGVACAVACAVLSYRFVERPTIRIGRRLAARVR